MLSFQEFLDETQNKMFDQMASQGNPHHSHMKRLGFTAHGFGHNPQYAARSKSAMSNLTSHLVKHGYTIAGDTFSKGSHKMTISKLGNGKPNVLSSVKK